MLNSEQDAVYRDRRLVAIDVEQVRSKSGVEIAEGPSGRLYERRPLASWPLVCSSWSIPRVNEPTSAALNSRS